MLEVTATVLLGIAVVAIAWATFQASKWGGQRDKALAESVLLSNEANDGFQQFEHVRRGPGLGRRRVREHAGRPAQASTWCHSRRPDRLC